MSSVGTPSLHRQLLLNADVRPSPLVVSFDATSVFLPPRSSSQILVFVGRALLPCFEKRLITTSVLWLPTMALVAFSIILIAIGNRVFSSFWPVVSGRIMQKYIERQYFN